MKCQDIDKNKLFTISFIKVILQHFEVICGRIRNTLFSSYLMNGPNKLQYYTTLGLKSFSRGKYSSLLGKL